MLVEREVGETDERCHPVSDTRRERVEGLPTAEHAEKRAGDNIVGEQGSGVTETCRPDDPALLAQLHERIFHRALGAGVSGPQLRVVEGRFVPNVEQASAALVEDGEALVVLPAGIVAQRLDEPPDFLDAGGVVQEQPGLREVREGEAVPVRPPAIGTRGGGSPAEPNGHKPDSSAQIGGDRPEMAVIREPGRETPRAPETASLSGIRRS